MFICNDCGEVFEEAMVVTDHYPYGDTTVPYDWYVCPNCKENNISRAVECSHCGEIISEDASIIDDKLEHRYCETCYEDLFYV